MKQPKITELKKYLSAILKMNKKYVTTERLSKVVGVYPDVINETMIYFEPMINMDPDFNLMELVPVIKKYIIDKEEERSSTLLKRNTVTKKTLVEYDSIGDFVYKKFTIAGGLLDKNAALTDKDLKILKRLINEEQAKRKKK